MIAARQFLAGVLGVVLAAPVNSPPLTEAERTAMTRTLAEASAHGLPQRPAATGDEALIAGVLAYAADQSGGRLAPKAVDALWGVSLPERPARASLEIARSTASLVRWLNDLPPAEPGYHSLLDLRRRYAALAATGGWPVIPAGKTVKPEGSDPRLPLLRRRLQIEGFIVSDDPDPAVLGPGLADALARFQRAHDLDDDAVMGPTTVAELNITPAARVDQIDANLERWRWLPKALPADRIEVDIASATAAVFDGDKPLLHMNVVVGDARHKTPLFYSEIDGVVFNPPWNVPASIARNEILPKAAKDAGYLARNHYRYVDGRLQQAPGPGSALGVLKFDFPSPYGVYLHDTPGKAAFALPRRALSHGCMRLEKPVELAQFLLGRQGWTAADVPQAIAAGETKRVDLDRTLPLYVVYRTVEAIDGGARFHLDTYGWDQKLTSALRGHAPVRTAGMRTESECSVAA